MLQISKMESMVIRERVPQAHIAVTGRKASSKNYYVEENRETRAILRELRGEPEEQPRKHRNRKRGAERQA